MSQVMPLFIPFTLIAFLLRTTTTAYPWSERVDDLLVNTNYGYVLGSREYSRNSREFASFRGIPFAQSPTGDLRFQNPLPPNLWNSPYNATVDAPICLQTATSSSSEVVVVGEEDCLFLNIYVPKIEGGPDDLLPVMVYIPGGGLETGGGASTLYGAQYFMDKDIILVTFNYRLAALGFVSTLDDEAPGNFAFKDQVMALRFVNENIEYFGGDKDRVTLFGESAGSVSVGLQLLSPLSDGLFQGAIAQSGTDRSAWSFDNNEHQLNVTNTLANLVGCGEFIGDSKTLLECFRNLDAKIIVGNQTALSARITTTVTETKTDRNYEPFLEKSPLDYIESGEFKKIPFIFGSNQDEGILVAGPLLKIKEMRDILNANFDTMLPELLGVQPGPGATTEELVKNLTKFYLGGAHFVNVSNPTRIQGFINMLSDRMFHYPLDQIVIEQYLEGQESFWVYNFNYRGNYSFGDNVDTSDMDFNWGVSHGDDIQYLFESPGYMSALELDGLDLQVSEDILTFWTNFAIFGNPDPNEDFWGEVNFGADVSSENLNYLNITGSLVSGSVEYKMQQGYKVERMELWSELNFEGNS